jgi:hypothetical protein
MDDGGVRVDALERIKRMPHRSRCDPLIYFSITKNECGHIRAGDEKARTGELADVVDLDLSLRSKRNSATEFRQVIDIRNFCAADPAYDIWRHNAWIILRTTSEL